MSDAPERIWLNLGNEPITYHEAMKGEVTWCEDQQHEYDVAYVRADLHDPEQFNIAYAKQAERIEQLERERDEALQRVKEYMEEADNWHDQWEGMCSERNYAQERIEQLERERDEARALVQGIADLELGAAGYCSYPMGKWKELAAAILAGGAPNE